MNEKKFDYQLKLIDRRWQYFAAYLIIIGLISNSIPSDLWEKPEIIMNYNWIIVYFLAIVIFIGIIFSHLVSITTKRIELFEIKIKEEDSITNLRLEGQFLGLSETLLLYLLIYIINSFLTVCVFKLNVLFSLFLMVIQIINLFFLKWKAINRKKNHD